MNDLRFGESKLLGMPAGVCGRLRGFSGGLKSLLDNKVGISGRGGGRLGMGGMEEGGRLFLFLETCGF